MALTRKALKAMALTEEQVDSIVEMHTETISGLRAEISRYKEDAEKLPALQQELETLKNAGDDGYKARYEAEHSAFEAYKAEQTGKEVRAAKEKAVRTYYEGKGIKGANLEIAMKGSGAEIDALELDGENIKDASSLDSLVGGTFAGLVSGAATFNWTAPVGNTGTQTNGTNQTMNALIRGAAK